MTTFPDDMLVSSEHEAHCMLVADSGDGDTMPCSRYGARLRYATAAVYAAAVIVAAETEGDPLCWRDLDYMAGLVVNDHDDVAYIIRAHGGSHGFDPADYELGPETTDNEED
jgi:hypothetical protein